MAETCEGGTANVLRAVRRVGPMHVVYVSSVLAVGSRPAPEPLDETTPYQLFAEKALTHSHHKYRAEELCRREAAAGADVVMVDYRAEVYGPDDVGPDTAGNLIDFSRGNPVLVCRGGTSIVHIEDVARGILAAVERGRSGERYILGGENITHRGRAVSRVGQQSKSAVLHCPQRPAAGGHQGGPGHSLPAAVQPPRGALCDALLVFRQRQSAPRELGLTFRSGPGETLAPTVAWLKAAELIG